MRIWERAVLGRTIRATVECLDEGWDVSVFGGDMTHVGAVTLAGPKGKEQTLERPGHKDAAVTRRWAVALAEVWGGPICVRCGIHFDHVTRTDLAQLLTVCEELLDVIKRTNLMERSP